jgi:hypothetical protein
MGKRTVKTVYYINGRKPKITRSNDANRAVSMCQRRMFINQYGARVAEVYDDITGELHAVVRLSANGVVRCIPKRDAREYETQYAAGWLLGL